MGGRGCARTHNKSQRLLVLYTCNPGNTFSSPVCNRTGLLQKDNDYCRKNSKPGNLAGTLSLIRFRNKIAEIELEDYLTKSFKSVYLVMNHIVFVKNLF